MNRAVFIVIFILSFNLFAKEQDRSTLTLNIKRVKNDIITLYSRPNNRELRDHLLGKIDDIKSAIREFAKEKSQKDIKNILEYLLFNIDKIKERVSEKKSLSKDETIDLIDSCRSMLEGVSSIEDNSLFSVNKLTKDDIEALRTYYLLKRDNIESEITEDKYHKILNLLKNKHFTNKNSSESFIKILNNEKLFLPNIIYILGSKLEGEIDGK